nr:hypothetical protein FVER53263_14074 [Fusarium verticillioides]
MAHLFVATVKPSTDADEAATPTPSHTTDEIRESLLRSACRRDANNPNLKLEDVRYALSHFNVGKKAVTRQSQSARPDSESIIMDGEEESTDTQLQPEPQPEAQTVIVNAYGKHLGSPLVSVSTQSPKRARTANSEGASSLLLNSPLGRRTSSVSVVADSPRTAPTHLPHALANIPYICSTLVKKSEDDSLSCSTQIDELTKRISTGQRSLSNASLENTIATLATKRAELDAQLMTKASIEKGKAIFDQHKHEMALDPVAIDTTTQSYNARLQACEHDIAQLQPEVTALKDQLRKDEASSSALQSQIENDTLEKNRLEASFREIGDKTNYLRVIGSLVDLGPDGLARLTSDLAKQDISLFDLAHQIQGNGPIDPDLEMN